MGHIAWAFWRGLNGALGPEPIKALEHIYGLTGLQILIAVLAITPIQQFTRISLIKHRRALALSGFLYIVAHLMVWLLLDVQILAQVWAEIVKRPYITVGMVGFALMVPLALTSNNFSMRRMGGRAWKRLHRLTYPAILLGGVHFVMLRKGFQVEPLIYVALVMVFLALRIRKTRFLSRILPVNRRESK